jgi:VWFA-related protein
MNRRWSFAGVLVALAGAALSAGQAGQSATAQQPPLPTFKADVEYVEVDALVTDAQGQFVRNLTKDEFQVFEDGKRQNLANFSLIDIPVERAVRPLFAARPLEPDVYTNERPFDGRVYVLVLDDYHVDALRTQRVRAAARLFIERNLGANDLMAVISTGGRAQDAQEFTSNKRLLLAAVDKFMGQKLRSATLNRNDEFYRLQGAPEPLQGRPSDPDEQQRAYFTRNTLSTLQKVAEWFGGVRGRRKTMLFVSEGIDYDLTDIIRGYNEPSSQASSILQDIRDAIAATARSNVSIYSIDPRGLAGIGDETIGVTDLADHEDPSNGIGERALQNELRVAQDSLRQLADETGGFAAINRNDFREAFDRIVRDNSSYYVLAYYPPSDKRDGKFHRIEVKVTRPGLTVRSRRGYVSPRGKAPQPVKSSLPPELTEAMNSPLPISGLTMRAFATPFKGTAPNASVLLGVEVLGRDLSLEANSKLELSYMAVDSKGKIFGAKNDAVTLNLRPETKTRVQQSAIRILNRIDLPAGRYQVRIATRDATKATVGSILYDLEVPDFYKQDFAISGITMTSLGSGGMMTAKQDEPLRAVLPAPPVAQRVFAQNDELALFAEIYDNQNRSPHKVDITTQILTDEGRVLFKHEDTRDSSELQGAKGAFGYTTRIPLTEIPPGPYVLSVQGRSRLGNGNVAERQIQIEIVAPRR